MSSNRSLSSIGRASNTSTRATIPAIMSVSHLLHTRWPHHLRALLYKCGNVEGKIPNRLIDLDVMPSGFCRPDPIMIFLKPAEQTHPRLGVGPTPVLAHALLPQIPQGLIPVIIKELGDLLQMMVCTRLDILAQLLQSALGLGFAVRMVKDIPQLPDNTAEAVHKTLILAFQCCKSLLLLCREIAWLLEEA